MSEVANEEPSALFLCNKTDIVIWNKETISTWKGGK